MSKHEFVRYVDFKANEITWLIQAPSHWVCNRVKELSITISKGTTPSTEGFVFTDEGVRFIKAENIGYTKIVSLDPIFYISEEANSSLARSQLKINDLLIVIAGATIGKVGIVVENLLPANTNQAVCFVRFFKKNNLNFLYYLFTSDYFSNYIWYSIVQSAQPNLPMGVLGNFILFIPPTVEQKTIANYLDTKTAQIDRKIDLLTQKATKYSGLKKSLINETVTRGLDKTVEMKDSGVEWIGDVPKHWEVKRVKELFDVSRGRVIAQTELIDDGKYPVYSSQTKDDGCLGSINTFDYEGEYITWTTDGANAGTVFLRRGRFNCTNICGTLKLNKKRNHIGYLTYSLQVSTKHNKRIDTNGAKIMSNEMMFIKIAVPPETEQKDISDYLDNKTAHIDHIVETINTQIEKLKELRRTLINDVVTGKIKVTMTGDAV
jgi:type I restriction enzyme S subunit